MKLKTIRERLDNLPSDTFCGEIEIVVERLRAYGKQYSSRYKSFDIDIEYEYGENPDRYVLYGTRLETEAEYNKRIKEAKRLKADRDRLKKAEQEAEYAEYLKLKEKFESK